MTKPLLLTLFVFVFSCGSKVQENNDSIHHQAQKLTEDIWAKDVGLRNIESIIHDVSNRVFYVSNGESYETGYAGYLSKLSETGELLQLSWADSLSRPTGMAIHDQLLYVADVTTLVVIDIETNQIVKKYPAPVRNPGLNDVAIDEQGQVYVSASFVHAILRLVGDELELWLQDEERLKWANGLSISNGQLIVGGLDLHSINLTSKEIRPVPTSPVVHDFDGIARDSKTGYWLTTVDNSALWHLDHHGHIGLVDSTSSYYGDLTIVNDQLYIPRGNHSSHEYYLSVFKIELPKGSFP